VAHANVLQEFYLRLGRHISASVGILGDVSIGRDNGPRAGVDANLYFVVLLF
jgi:hypothetical protein